MEHEAREIMKPLASIHDATRQFITIGKKFDKSNAKALVTNDFFVYHKCFSAIRLKNCVIGHQLTNY